MSALHSHARSETQATYAPPAPAALFLEQDVDYVAAFHDLTEIEETLKEGGLSAELMVRRSRITHALGDYRQSAEDSVLAAYLDPEHVEAHFRAGVAFLALAALRMGMIPRGPGILRAPALDDDPDEILDAARRAFTMARQLEHPHADAGAEAERHLSGILARQGD